ncbi:hypothetical protein L873DRAFT_1818754, partial [Choiromyces venosus 120613-1]
MTCWDVQDDSWWVVEVVTTLLEVVRKLEINDGERGSLWIVSSIVEGSRHVWNSRERARRDVFPLLIGDLSRCRW